MGPLRDHALIYNRVLREEYGIATKLDLYPGLRPHILDNLAGDGDESQDCE
jgi:hypothetical protein